MDELFALGNVPDAREIAFCDSNATRLAASLEGSPHAPVVRDARLAALLTMRNNLAAS
jgi:hypothetical protein